MWFKTLHLYRVHDAVALALPVLNEALQEQAFRPLGSAEAKRMG
ncbi:recombination-associated protein RdgC, partial [Halomonas sp. BBD48]|nr:recombination-associated protein RdgC [Halomonas sp. BBD48]